VGNSTVAAAWSLPSDNALGVSGSSAETGGQQRRAWEVETPVMASARTYEPVPADGARVVSPGGQGAADVGWCVGVGMLE